MQQHRGYDFDIIIVGSGPAGISTALHLLRQRPDLAGRLLVLERARHPRKKLCGGGITPDTDRWLARMGLDLPITTLELRQTRLVFEHHVLESEPIRTVCREEFDAALAQKAAAAGLLLSEGERLLSVDIHENGVFATTDQHSLWAAVVVGADGSNSIVRQHIYRQQDARPPMAVCRTLRVMRRVDRSDSPEHTKLEAVFDFRCLTQHRIQGYCWSFPAILDGEPWLNLGICDFGTTSLERRPLAPALEEFLGERGLSLSDSQVESHPIRWFHPDALLSAPRVVLVGDAAGIDPLFADGISCSLAYGDVVATAIARAFDSGDFSFSEYRNELLQHELGALLQLRFHLATELYGFERIESLASHISPTLPPAQTESAPTPVPARHVSPIRRLWQKLPPPVRSTIKKILGKGS